MIAIGPMGPSCPQCGCGRKEEDWLCKKCLNWYELYGTNRITGDSVTDLGREILDSRNRPLKEVSETSSSYISTSSTYWGKFLKSVTDRLDQKIEEMNMASSEDPHLFVGISAARVKKIRALIRDEIKEEVIDRLENKLRKEYQAKLEAAEAKLNPGNIEITASEFKAVAEYLEEVELAAMTHGVLWKKRADSHLDNAKKLREKRDRYLYFSALMATFGLIIGLLFLGAPALLIPAILFPPQIFIGLQLYRSDIKEFLEREERCIDTVARASSLQAATRSSFINLASAKTKKDLTSITTAIDKDYLRLQGESRFDPTDVAMTKDVLRVKIDGSESLKEMRIAEFDDRLAKAQAQAENEAIVAAEEQRLAEEMKKNTQRI